MRLPTAVKIVTPPASLRRVQLVGVFLFLLLGGCPASPGTAPPAPVPSPAPAPVPPVVPTPVPPAPTPEPPASPPDAAVGSSPAPGPQLRSCADVRAAYKALLTAPAHTRCSADAECQIVSGECALGLGGCYHAVNQAVAQAAVSAFGARYQELSCTGPVCRCARPPVAHCVQSRCALP